MSQQPFYCQAEMPGLRTYWYATSPASDPQVRKVRARCDAEEETIAGGRFWWESVIGSAIWRTKSGQEYQRHYCEPGRKNNDFKH